MKIRLRSGGITLPPHILEDIDSFVLELDDGTPVVAGFDNEGAIIVARAGDGSFKEMLATLGYKGNAPSVTVQEF